MTFGQFLSILKARKWVAMAVFFLIVVSTTVVSLRWPKQYTGTASVLAEVKADPVSIMGFPTVMQQGFMSTQVDILTSDRVALRVIRDLKLLDNPQILRQWREQTQGQGTIELWLIGALQGKLEVRPSKESSVINIMYKSPDPRFAAAMANAYAQAYIATTLDLRVDPAKQYSTFFDTQAKEARDALERAQAKVSEFQRENGIIATDERLDVENARLNELSSQLVQIQAVASESGSRQSQAQGAASDRIQEVLGNAAIGNMKVDLTQKEAKLQELNAKYGDNHPQVVEAKANIAELRSKIESEIRRVTGGVGVTNTINRQREAQIAKELEMQRAKVLRMKGVRDEGQVLVREAENAQRAFDAVMTRLTQSSLESQTTQSYVNILTTASPPAVPSSPKVLLNIGLAIVVGAFLAVFTALLLELRDRRIRAPEDVLASLGLHVIGILPKPNAKRFLSRRRLSLMQQRVIGLPGSTKGA